MNLGQRQPALELLGKLIPGLSQLSELDLVICPPFTVLAELAQLLEPTPIALGAQNMHWEDSGAHTGEISPTMLAGLCQYVIIGHSERRAAGGEHETDLAIHRKLGAALTHGITPILCLGENLEQNRAGETHDFISKQVRSAFEGIKPEQARSCVIAYEPIWAIGTGEAATPVDANRVIGLSVRGALVELYGERVAGEIRVQYGGSVTAENIADFMTMPEVDGALVGGASLKPGFVELAQRALG
jgi:triosephosphate isomerase